MSLIETTAPQPAQRLELCCSAKADGGNSKSSVVSQ